MENKNKANAKPKNIFEFFSRKSDVAVRRFETSSAKSKVYSRTDALSQIVPTEAIVKNESSERKIQ